MITFTGTQLICHLLGDYVLQSSWMALNKTKSSFVAAIHALTYSIPFCVFLHPSLASMIVIIGTHFAIDRWRLARYVAYFKEFLSPTRCWKTWEEHKETGFDRFTPPFMSSWLLIIIDNTLHIVINGIALYHL